jgi:6-phospho-3-hexuloisomerase
MINNLLDVLSTLKEILGGVSEEEVESLIKELLTAYRQGNKVFVAAAGRANLVIRTFAMRLMQIGFKSYVVFDTSTPAMERGDLLIVASGSGATQTVVVIAQKAKAFGGRVALIGKQRGSILAQSADVVLHIPTQLCTRKLQTKGSEFEQCLFILCDVIGVELIMRLNLISDLSKIDDFIQIRHANLQ